MKHPKIFITDETTSKRMSNVKLKKGLEETMLAKMLWSKGFRYRLNYKKLPGSPDIAITRDKVAIFVDGEFWHGHDWENKKNRLKRNREYWIEKIEENINRDRIVDQQLSSIGWLSLHFWSKDVKRDCESCANEVIKTIREMKRDIK